MADTSTVNKNYLLMATGSSQGTWGGRANTQVFSVIDLNFGGRLSKSVAGSSNVTITSTEAQNVYHTLTGVLTGNIQYIIPATGSFYFIKNSTTGAFTVTVIGPSGTGTALPQGRTTIIFNNPDTPASAPAFDWLPTLTLNNTGLQVYDTDASNVLKIVPGSNLTADRTLTFTTGDANRTITVSSDTTIGVTTTQGDMISRGASADQRLAIGAANTLLATDGTNPIWTTLSVEIDTLGSTRGMILNRGASTWGTTAIGAANTILATDGNDPLWRTLSAEIDAAAGSTRGEILVRGASTWGVVTVGANGTVLSSNGTDPSWQPSAGSYLLLQSQVASNSATIDFINGVGGCVLDDTYDAYEVVLSSIKPVTNNADFWLRVGIGGTPTWQTGTNYNWQTSSVVSGTQALSAAIADTKILLSEVSGGGVGNGAGKNYNAEIQFNNPEQSDYLNFRYNGTYNPASSTGIAPFLIDGCGFYVTAQAYTAIRFMFSTGNISSGRFSLYAYKKI